MKKQSISLFILFVAAVMFTACVSLSSGSGNNTITLTVGASENIAGRVKHEGNFSWTSSDEAVVKVDQDGTITALRFTNPAAGTGTAQITAYNASGVRAAVFTVNTTMAGQVDMMTLPPMKEQFSEYFLIGNIFHNGRNRGDEGIPSDVPPGSTTVANERLIRHYNILTPEDEMKPASLCDSNTPGKYNQRGIDVAKRMVDAAINSGFKVVGHTLIWHSQIPLWQQNIRTDKTSKEEALKYMEDFVTDIVTEFKGKIYSWDIMNEVFPDGGFNPTSNWRDVMRKDTRGNPWYMKIGSDFVYRAYLAARNADPDAILYYNDYNLDQTGKARMVRDMVRDVNEQYKKEHGGTRLLIEGIGMQSHHNTGVTSASISSTINLFRQLGVRISISELDILSQTYGQYSSNPAHSTTLESTATYQGKIEAARLFGEYFQVFLRNADIIERVTFWGVCDDQSWRAKGLPLLFEGTPVSRAKPGYYKMIEALNQRQNAE